jgi:hypothetical protein
MIPRRRLTRCASTMHERDDLVVLQFVHVSILCCNSFMFQFSDLHILVPAASRTKTQFAAIKQGLNHPEYVRFCEHASLVVDHGYGHSHWLWPQSWTSTTSTTAQACVCHFMNLHIMNLHMTQASAQQQPSQSWKTRKRTAKSWGITGSELNRLSGAVRFMDLRCGCELWWATTNNNTSRPLIHDVWKRITRLQGENGLLQYSVAVFEGRGGIHLHVIFEGNRAIARRLKASKQFGDLIHVARVKDADKLVRGYLAKERTQQAGYQREHVFGGRLRGSHRLDGGGDRVRLSRQLERDAITSGYVRPWRHTYAKRTDQRKKRERAGRRRSATRRRFNIWDELKAAAN